jgi:paraquat-inducible protein B
MSSKANPTLIGAFVLGALALAVVATLLLAGGSWFGERRQHVLYFEGRGPGPAGRRAGGLPRRQGRHGEADPARPRRAKPRFLVPVMIEVQPQVVRPRGGENVDLRDRATVRQLVERGLRGALRLQSLLTGQLYVDLDFHPDKPAVFAALDPDLSEIPTIRTTVQELTTKLEGFPMDKFLADVAAISGAVNKLMSAQATQDLPQRLDVTLRHLQSLAAALRRPGRPHPQRRARQPGRDEQGAAGGAGRAGQARHRGRPGGRPGKPDSRMVAGMTQASEELAKAAARCAA